ncbi:MAG: hypothetical protein LBR11_00460 [Deltaproteobacteria bacterium]|nr:hypothetical protein [Deltaproteobacteria bacterium]
MIFQDHAITGNGAMVAQRILTLMKISGYPLRFRPSGKLYFSGPQVCPRGPAAPGRKSRRGPQTIKV